MASTIIVNSIPDGLTYRAWANITQYSVYMGQNGKLYIKLDASTALDVVAGTTETAPGGGYECDITVTAVYK